VENKVLVLLDLAGPWVFPATVLLPRKGLVTHGLTGNAIGSNIKAADQDANNPVFFEHPVPFSPSLPDTTDSIVPAYLQGNQPSPTGADLQPFNDPVHNSDLQFLVELFKGGGFLELAGVRPALVAIGTPLQIAQSLFKYVYDTVKYVHYYGLMNGAGETLWQTAGNDLDQAALLVEMYGLSGIPARFVGGVIEITPQQAASWLSVSSGTDAYTILQGLGVPVAMQANGDLLVQHCWVEAYTRRWVAVDPSFKQTSTKPGINFFEALGIAPSQLAADLASTPVSQLPSFYDNLQQKIFNVITSTPNAGLPETAIVGMCEICTFPPQLPCQVVNVNEGFSSVPSVLEYSINIQVDGISYTLPTWQLAGSPLSVLWYPATANDMATTVAKFSFDPNYYGLLTMPTINVVPILYLRYGAVAIGNPISLGTESDVTLTFYTPGVLSYGSSNIAGLGNGAPIETRVDYAKAGEDRIYATTTGRPGPRDVQYLAEADMVQTFMMAQNALDLSTVNLRIMPAYADGFYILFLTYDHIPMAEAIVGAKAYVFPSVVSVGTIINQDNYGWYMGSIRYNVIRSAVNTFAESQNTEATLSWDIGTQLLVNEGGPLSASLNLKLQSVTNGVDSLADSTGGYVLSCGTVDEITSANEQDLSNTSLSSSMQSQVINVVNKGYNAAVSINNGPNPHILVGDPVTGSVGEITSSGGHQSDESYGNAYVQAGQQGIDSYEQNVSWWLEPIVELLQIIYLNRTMQHQRATFKLQSSFLKGTIFGPRCQAI